jgi:hypothetical protein
MAAREQVMAALADRTLLDRTEIVAALADWAIHNLEIDEAVAKRKFERADVYTETQPRRSLFRIRIRLAT